MYSTQQEKTSISGLRKKTNLLYLALFVLFYCSLGNLPSWAQYPSETHLAGHLTGGDTGPGTAGEKGTHAFNPITEKNGTEGGTHIGSDSQDNEMTAENVFRLKEMGMELAAYIDGRMPQNEQAGFFLQIPGPLNFFVFWNLSESTRQRIIQTQMETVRQKLPSPLIPALEKLSAKYNVASKRYAEVYWRGNAERAAVGKAFAQSLTEPEKEVLKMIDKIFRNMSGAPYTNPNFVSLLRISPAGENFLQQISSVSPTAASLLTRRTLFQSPPSRENVRLTKMFDSGFFVIATEEPPQTMAAPCHCVEGYDSTCNDFRLKKCQGGHCPNVSKCTIIQWYFVWEQICSGRCSGNSVIPEDGPQY